MTKKTRNGANRRVGMGASRSFAIGIAGVALLCAATPYNNFHLKGTFLYGNHLPVGALFLWLVLGQLINPLLRRFKPVAALSMGELLLIWTMWTAGACLAGSGLWRMLAPSAAAPAYFASQGNGSALTIFAKAPSWFLLSRDPSDPNVQAYWNGSPGGVVPWLAWGPVLLGWGVGFTCLAAFGIGMSALLRKRWQEAERLSYPLARIPLIVSEIGDGQAGGQSQAVRLMLFLGVALVLIHHTAATAHTLYPSLPDVPTAFPMPNPTDPPWSAIGIGNLEIYFAAIGAVFLLPSDIAFSLWFTYLAFHLLRVVRVSAGFEPMMSGPLNHEGAMGVGVFVAWTVTLLWAARDHLREAWTAAFGKKQEANKEHDASAEVLPYRMAYLLTGTGFAGLVGWLWAAGLAPFQGGLVIAASIAIVVFVLSRILAESGMLFLMVPFGLLDVQRAFGGVGINPHSIGTAYLSGFVLAGDVREHPIPALTNGFSLANAAINNGETPHAALTPRHFAVGAALAMLTGYLVGGAANLMLAYRYGEVSLDLWSGLGSNNSLRVAASYGEALAPGAGGGGMAAGVLGWAGVGAALTVLLSVMRASFMGWMLAPIGLALAGTYAMDRFFFSVFLGWLFKIIILRWGGARIYQGAIPFFLGMIVGEAVFAGAAAIFGLLTGIACPPFLPT